MSFRVYRKIVQISRVIDNGPGIDSRRCANRCICANDVFFKSKIMRNNVGSLMWDLDERYEFFESSTLDGRDSNNRYFPINRKRIVQP